ncbi:hypothetical protein [Bradyrhizobium niftali]|uniref:hypothetical protein n=1 Tax=Bradyrhizobium niftali TaxID=2560055 RepID=UPI001F31AE72|nr:hypothetical protein [Bradyrhizobium niftali]
MALQSTRYSPRSQNLRRRDFVAGAALVDGRWIAVEQSDTEVDPAAGEEIAEVVCCAAADMNLAIAAAERFLPGKNYCRRNAARSLGPGRH